MIVDKLIIEFLNRIICEENVEVYLENFLDLPDDFVLLNETKLILIADGFNNRNLQ